METSKITYRLIEQYLQGTLDEKSMHELERQALNDPFLADALDGYTRSDGSAAPQLSLLQKQLEERIAVHQENKNRFHFGWQRISVAAAACLLFISASILFWMKGNRNQQSANLPASTEKMVEVMLMDKDSAQAIVMGRHDLAVAAQPQLGWTAFQEYLAKNKKTTVSGTVTVLFKVSPDGQPSDVVVLRSTADALNAEALRLIKDGPKWTNAEGKNVMVKMEF